MVPVIAFTSVLQGFQSTKVYTANRELAIARISLLEISAQMAGAAVMVGWAYLHRSVWALVAGAIVSNLVKTLLTHTMLPGVPTDCAGIAPTPARSSISAAGSSSAPCSPSWPASRTG